MERLALKDIENWNEKKKRKPLLVTGARQVGKTYLIKNLFAEKYFKSNYLYINFIDSEFSNIKNFIDNNISAKKIIEFLEITFQRKIDNNILIIFDEIQECLGALTSLKLFAEEFPDLRIIASGSLVRIKLNRISKDKNFLFPLGKIEELKLYPLNFEEYLINFNNILYEKIKNAYENKVYLSKEIHEYALSEFYKFLVLGGLPEVLATYKEKESFFDATSILKPLFENYLNDMSLYQVSNETQIRTRKVFNNIYHELNKDNKNFKFSNIEEKASYREFFNPILWLEFSNIVLKSNLVKERVTYPLKEIDDNSSIFRLYLFDTGILAYESRISIENFIDSKIENTFIGPFLENYIAIELQKNQIPLYYWKGKNNAEIEFLLMSKNRIIPLDVKKGRGTLNSLEKYTNFNECNLAIKVSKNNFGYNEEQKLLTIPFYMFFLLSNEIKDNKI